MTTTNGANHHSVEDLLSSIRTSINDEPIGLRPGPSIPMPAHTRRDGALGDDNAEFELPAIFKPSHQQPQAEKTNNLFGRLSDAMKSATEPDRSRTVIRFEPAGGRMIEPPAPAHNQAPPQQMAKPTRHEQPAEPVERAPLRETAPVRREMPSFFDTRINRLGEMTREANEPKQLEPPKPVAQAPQPPPLRHPMQHSAEEAQGTPSGGLEDAAAQLLRPILKQWLTDNMPKIVEKALRSEAGEDFSQPSNAPNHPPIGRKPGTLR